MTTATESPAATLARIQRMGFCDNDVAVVMHFANCGVEPENITPRENVLTYRAWLALGRQVAKGATGFKFSVWIPCKPTKRQRDTGDDTPKLRRKATTVFHLSQTIDAADPKGTRPVAWNNPHLVKPGTYESEPICHDSPEPLYDVHGASEANNEAAYARPHIVREEHLELDDSGSLVAVAESTCNCPMAGIVTNVDCPLHGTR